MAKEFKLQDPGEGIHEAEIREIKVSKGNQVEDGDTLMSIETDKAVTDVPAPFTGTIEEIKVKQGDLVQVGDVLVTYTEEGAPEEAEAEEKAKEKEEKKEKEKKEKKTREEEKEKEAKEKEEARAKEKEKERKARPKKAPEEGPVPASPATRRLARELGVDLHEVEPSGPEGRVTAEDVQAFAEGKEKKKPEEEKPRKPARPAAIEAPPLPDFTRWGTVEREPLRSVRRSTARQMALAWSQIPHVMHKDVADITELEKFRRHHKKHVEDQGGKLTVTVLVMKAVIAALKQFPRFNASLDLENQEIIVKQYHHIGVAVATEQGLLVPVVRDADRKSITELSVEFTELAERTRQGEVKREEMQGGTFTITNPGPIGGISFTPIINYPEVAILGLGKVQLEPVAQGDLDNYEIVARLRMPLCLVYDHRVNDGAIAAHFLRTIIDTLHDPESYLLSV